MTGDATTTKASDKVRVEPPEDGESSAAPPAPEAESDLGEIAPEPGGVVTIGGHSPEGPIDVRVNRLRTIEFLALMRALVAGAGPAVAEMDFSSDREEAVGEIVALCLMAIPEAGVLFVDFIDKVTVPAVPTTDGKARERVHRETRNPELEDTLAILEMVAIQEVDDIQGLVGKAQSMWGRLVKMYQKKGPKLPTG
jgi:hypothetical protein